MKVYVVIGHWDHEGDDILGIFSTREKAEHCKDNPKSNYDDISIQEWDVE